METKNKNGRPRKEDKKQEFLRLFALGTLSYEQKASILGVGIASLYRWRRELGLPRRSRQVRYAKAQLNG